MLQYTLKINLLVDEIVRFILEDVYIVFLTSGSPFGIC